MSKKSPTWVLIADAGSARIYGASQSEDGPRYIQLFNFDNEEGRKRSRDLGSDRLGRSMESVGGARHAEEQRTDPHWHAKQVFAQRLAEHLARNAQAQEFERLVLIAAPQMLGDLRDALGPGAKAKVVREVAKDLMKMPTAKLSAELAKLLA